MAFKTYQGFYKLENPEKYRGDTQAVIYRSGWERSCFIWCDRNEGVESWSSEEIVIPYLFEVDKKYHRYFMDLKITFKTGKTLLVEVKPKKQTKPPTGKRRTRKYITEGITYVQNMNKWSAAKEYAESRGWQFVIWTEDELVSLGILPKLVKPLKPFKKPSK